MAERSSIPSRRSEGSADPLRSLREIAAGQKHAVLAVESDGRPYPSLVAFALASGGRGVVFATSRDTRKYRSLRANPSVSLLIDTRSNTGRDYLNAESITVEGRARTLRRGRLRDEMAGLLHRKHPRLGLFLDAPSTAIVLVEARQVVHVGRFREVSVWMSG